VRQTHLIFLLIICEWIMCRILLLTVKNMRWIFVHIIYKYAAYMLVWWYIGDRIIWTFLLLFSCSPSVLLFCAYWQVARRTSGSYKGQQQRSSKDTALQLGLRACLCWGDLSHDLTVDPRTDCLCWPRLPVEKTLHGCIQLIFVTFCVDSGLSSLS
jgi:hypothetical protein